MHSEIIPPVPSTMEKLLQDPRYQFWFRLTNYWFWRNKWIGDVVKQRRYSKHLWCHTKLYFKKGIECRYGPLPWQTSGSRFSFEDRGSGGEHEIDWCGLNGEVNEVLPWMVLPIRPVGWQYMNLHNQALPNVLNCYTHTRFTRHRPLLDTIQK